MEDYEQTSNITTPFLARWVADHPDLKMGGETSISFKDFRGLIRYLCHRDHQTFPFYSAKSFNKAITSYPPWTVHRVKGDKILLTCQETILQEAREYMIRYKARIKRERSGSIAAAYSGPGLPIPVCDNIKKDYCPRVPRLATMTKDNDCVVLMTTPGLGKTEAIVQYIKELPIETPVVVVSFRVSLSEKQRADFAGESFVHYHDNCVAQQLFKLEDHPRVIIQVDSVWRLGWTNTNKNTIVILDEWESLDAHLYESPFIKNVPNLVERLTNLIRMKSKLTLLADANFSQGSIDFLRKICGKEPFLYYNDFILQRRSVYFLDSKAELIALIKQLLLEGLRIYLPTNSRDFGAFIYDALTKDPRFSMHRIGFYYSETEMLSGVDPISELEKFDCAIVTPKLQAGNSFVVKHFDVVCAYFTGASCSPEAASQLLMRVRDISTREAYIFVDNKLAPNVVALPEVNDMDSMVNYIAEKNHARSSTHCFLSSSKIATNVKLNNDHSLNMHDPATFLAVVCAVNQNEGRKSYLYHLARILRRMGYILGNKIVIKNVQSDQIVALEMNAFREQQKQKQAQAIAKAPDIDFRQASIIRNKLERQEKVEERDRNALKKHNLFEVFDLLQPNDPAMVAQARELKGAKIMMTRLLPLARTNRDQEQELLQSVINDVSDLPYVTGDTPPQILRFYQMKKEDKALIIGYLLSCLRYLGFDGFFDPYPREIDKKPLIAYLVQNRHKIEMITDKKFTEKQLTEDQVIRWLNSRLKFLHMSIQRVSRDTRYKTAHVIQSPWRLSIADEGVVVLTDKIEIITDLKEYRNGYAKIIEHLNAPFCYEAFLKKLKQKKERPKNNPLGKLPILPHMAN